MDDDRDLIDLFAAQRRSDAERAPGFAETLARARSQGRSGAPPTWRLALATAGVLAGLAVVLWHAPRPDRPERTPQPSVTQWRSPTESLLETPGRELLRSAPRLGEGFSISTPERRWPS